ncbi:pyridoxal-phosphate dependent enzyme [Clostridium sp.]|uniref:pyridoxal-phosphate dependent enzyme n=1 Tax=Clostridium sp. TaxID=1506 RepID=UPI001A3CB58B|nr:pyridoxal-phosphate dependent enzyme [Clostridium sp.]MBK5235589.1 pyridoxal-phosphate dependent enzyme [Clostridium sp.]
MRQSGRTPLMRARKMEKALGIGEIYLKLEGANPSGHKYDRISEVLVKDAIANGFAQILVDGSESYIKSVILFAELNELEVKVPLFKQEKWKMSRLNKDILMDLRDKKDTGTRTHAVTRAQLRAIARDNNMYLMCEWNRNNIISHLVLEDMTKECLERMNFEVDTITLQLGFGYTLSSIYGAIIKSWVHEKLVELPQLMCGVGPAWQESFDHYARKMNIGKIESSDSNAKETDCYLPNRHTDIVENIMKTINETGVEMISIEEDDYKKAVTMLRELEGVTVSRKEAYAMAAFIKKAQQGLIKDGKHLVILNDARSEVEICEIKSYEDKSKEELFAIVQDWLSVYHDCRAEAIDAIERAMKDGYVLFAKRNGEEQGICVIVKMGFDEFLSDYHLAYIGVKTGNKGRGVASELISRAIELTDGSISLHVDLDNKRAKNLYKKMGFKHVYDRMIYNYVHTTE